MNGIIVALCCLPFGLITIYYALKARELIKDPNPEIKEEVLQKLKIAGRSTGFGILCGAIMIGAVICVLFIVSTTFLDSP